MLGTTVRGIYGCGDGVSGIGPICGAMGTGCFGNGFTNAGAFFGAALGFVSDDPIGLALVEGGGLC